jgi:hypothetical protein
MWNDTKSSWSKLFRNNSDGLSNSSRHKNQSLSALNVPTRQGVGRILPLSLSHSQRTLCTDFSSLTQSQQTDNIHGEQCRCDPHANDECSLETMLYVPQLLVYHWGRVKRQRN